MTTRTEATSLADAALSYAARGWPVLPLHWPVEGRCSCGQDCGTSAAKHPKIENGLLDATTEEATIRDWWKCWPKANIGVATGNGLLVVDVDPRNGGDESLKDLERDLGELPDTPTGLTGGGGQHFLFAVSEDYKSKAGALGPGLDVKCGGGYVVAPPSKHISGGRYTWEIGHAPDEIALAPLPPVLAELAQDGRKPAEALPERILAGQRNDLLTSLAGSMRRRGASSEAIEAALLTENETRCEPPLPERDVQRIARSVGRYPVPEPVVSQPVSKDAPRFHRTDAGNGELFAHLYGDRARFDHRRHRWLLWRDHWWVPDADEEVQRLALKAANWRYKVAPDLFDDSNERKAEAAWAISSESRMRLDSCLALARAWRPIADAGADWDSHPWLLGVDNGVIDLRTGTLRDGRPDDRITMRSPVAYDPDAPYPHWLQFLDRVMAGNIGLIDFLQRAVGYSLTGDVSEQVLFFLHGTGANGKSTFLTVLLDALGDYGRQAPPGLLLAKRGERHPTEYADLEAARFVSSVEVDEGRRLAEGLVKWLTGGDRMKARKMRQDFFEFRPTYKIWLAANHKPTITGTDLAIWRRIRLVPFTVVIPPEEQDPHLPEKQRSELPGILAWAVQGCLDWQREGLGTPPEVLAATEAYRAEQDVLAGFLEDCCTIGSDEQVTANALYVAYTNWCKTSGEKQLTKTAFGLRLGERGFRPGRAYTEGRLWHGLGLAMTRSGGESDTP